MIVKITDEKDYDIEWDLAKQVIKEMHGIPVVIGRITPEADQLETSLDGSNGDDSGISLQMETGNF